MKRPIVLASTSPRRIQLLTEAKIPFSQHAPNDVEEKRNPGESAEQYVKRLALSKAKSGLLANPSACVIGADTIVISPSGSILEKPKDAGDAYQMLKSLQGNTHQVITGYAVIWDKKEIVRSILSLVQFRVLSTQAIESYIHSFDEWKDKAGSYAVQGIGASFVMSINGSYHNVVGLPLAQVVADLETVYGKPYPLFLNDE